MSDLHTLLSKYHRPLIVLLLAACSLLTGCKRNYGDIHVLPSATARHFTIRGNDINPLTNVATGRRVNSFDSSQVVTDSGQASADYYTLEDGRKFPIVYADIYWKLNWIRQQLNKGTVPPKFSNKLALIRKELDSIPSNIPRDNNFKVAEEATLHLERGEKHRIVDQTLLAAGATVFSAPWSSGSQGMKQYIDSGGFGFGGKSIANSPVNITPHELNDDDTSFSRNNYSQTAISSPLSLKQQKAIAIALDYADKYHAAPSIKMKEEWNQAILLTNKLRDQLWLMNRPQNRDNNSIVNVQPDQMPSDSFSDSDQFSSSYVKDGTDLPIGSAPVGDPFSVPTDTSRR